jgi:putative transposase
VPKGARDVGGLDEMIISLYAGGMTVRDIGYHLERTYGTDLSRETISKITDGVLEDVKEWQHRPLEEIYPIIYLDALVVKVRDGHQVTNRAAHIAVGVDLDGVKHVLGIWVQATEGAKFWAGVCAELANRGVKDVLIVCCDGLTGFPEAIEATWPRATVQTCVVHLIRAAMRYVSYADRKKVAAALRPIYTAPTADAAETELLAFADSELGQKYPAGVAVWENAWAGSSGASPRRSPLRTGLARCPRIRLKQAHWDRGMVGSGRGASRPYGRSGCGRVAKRSDRSVLRVAGRR